MRRRILDTIGEQARTPVMEYGLTAALVIVVIVAGLQIFHIML